MMTTPFLIYTECLNPVIYTECLNPVIYTECLNPVTGSWHEQHQRRLRYLQTSTLVNMPVS